MVARVDLSIPDLDQILTAPSSPPVTMPAPSQLHLRDQDFDDYGFMYLIGIWAFRKIYP